VEGDFASEDLWGTVLRFVVQERSAAGELVFHIRESSAAATRINVAPTAHGQADSVSGRHDNACWQPYFLGSLPGLLPAIIDATVAQTASIIVSIVRKSYQSEVDLPGQFAASAALSRWGWVARKTRLHFPVDSSVVRFGLKTSAKTYSD
jgi:hypothetical protein